jgi:hypothetical protein
MHLPLGRFRRLDKLEELRWNQHMTAFVLLAETWRGFDEGIAVNDLERTMMTGTKIALAAVLLMGVASTAQAGPDRGHDDPQRGGYHIGPFGQWLGGPSYRWRGYYSYGYAPAPYYYYRHYRGWRYRDY